MTDKELEDALERGSRQLALESAASVMLAALKIAEAHVNDEIRQFGARSDYADTDTLNVIKAAIAKAEGRE